MAPIPNPRRTTRNQNPIYQQDGRRNRTRPQEYIPDRQLIRQRNQQNLQNALIESEEMGLFAGNLHRTNNAAPDTFTIPTVPFYGAHEKKRFKKLVKKLGVIATSTFTRNYFLPFEENCVDEDILVTVSAILTHHGNGLNFNGNDWIGCYEAALRIDFFNLPVKLLVPLSATGEPRLTNNVPFITGPNEAIPKFLFQVQMSYIAKTMAKSPDFLIYYLEILGLDPNDNYEEYREQIFRKEYREKNRRNISLAMEKVGSLLKDPFVCWDCEQGLKNHEKAVRHVISRHASGFADPDEQVLRENAQIRILKDKLRERDEEILQLRQENRDLREDNSNLRNLI